MLTTLISRVLTKLRQDHLRDIAVAELAMLRELDIPLMKLVAAFPEEQIVAQTMVGLERFIQDLETGDALASTRASVTKWESEELEGFRREMVEPIDIIGVYGAQSRAILSHVARCEVTAEEAMAVTDFMLEIVTQMQDLAFQAYARIHRETVEKQVRAEADRAAAQEYASQLGAAHQELQAAHEELQAGNEELQTFNEELTTQSEELQAQQEELADMADQLRKRNETVEAEIQVRTAELRDEMIENARLQAEKIEALERADLVKDQFLAIVSHELRTPINAITGFGSILQDEVAGALTEQQHAYLAKMLRGSDMLLLLVDDLLDMSRIQAGKFSLELGPLSCHKVAEKVAQMLQPLVEQRKQTLVLELLEQEVDLVADERRIGQVLFNLLHNATKFTPEGGRITLRSLVAGEYMRFEVEDTGPGVPESEVSRVFERFTQLDMSSTRPAGGAGLGLSISKALIEAHSGQIGISAGSGAIVWFLLPLKSDLVPGPKT